MNRAAREAKIVAIREAAAWLTRTHNYPPPDSLRRARLLLAKELEDRADRLEARLLYELPQRR